MSSIDARPLVGNELLGKGKLLDDELLKSFNMFFQCSGNLDIFVWQSPKRR